MRILKTKWIILIIAAIVVAPIAVILATSTQPTGSQTLNMPKPFYGVNPALEAKLEQIVLADPSVQALIKDWDQTFTVAGHTIRDKSYSVAVGVRLKAGVNKDEFSKWQSDGRNQSPLIAEYVGTVSLGNNDKYEITIDSAQHKVSAMVLQTRINPAKPYATPEEKQRAVSIGLADSTVSKILEGKSYNIVNVGTWSNEGVKLGGAFQIQFDKAYAVDQVIPHYKMSPTRFTDQAAGIHILILLAENRVAEILMITPLAK